MTVLKQGGKKRHSEREATTCSLPKNNVIKLLVVIYNLTKIRL